MTVTPQIHKKKHRHSHSRREHEKSDDVVNGHESFYCYR